jgi:hypothetical protein
MDDYNLYDIVKIDELLARLQKFPLTTNRKSDHFARLQRAKDLLTDIAWETNCMLFKPDKANFAFNKYRINVKVAYKDTKKARLDTDLRYLIISTISELLDCKRIEENTHNGTLIKDPKYIGSWIEPEVLKLRK